MQRIVKPNFAASWEEIGEENQTEGTYALSSMKDISGTLKRTLIARTCIHVHVLVFMYMYSTVIYMYMYLKLFNKIYLLQ